MSNETVPVSLYPQMQLPNPPTRVPRLDAGESRLRAQQAAERAVTTGALDATGVEATTGDLPYKALRDAQAGVELATVALERLEAEASGVTLLESARQGALAMPVKVTATHSVVGLGEELSKAEERLTEAEARHDFATRVLAGAESAPDGSRRAGNPITPHATTEKAIESALRRMMWARTLPILIPIVVEGLAVTFNMHAYLRADDGNWIQPAVIALITVGILSISPYLLGIVANDQAHGKEMSPIDAVGVAVLAVFWVGVGITLALVRVQVDRNEAVRAAELSRRQAIAESQQLGQPVDVPPVDPGTVFEPILPTVFWVLVFVGFGVVLILWERTHRNPARVHELETRLARLLAVTRVQMLRAHAATLGGSINLQERINNLALQMWDAEIEVVRASARLDTAEYHRCLGEAAGDPEMPLAVEDHKRRRSAAGGVR